MVALNVQYTKNYWQYVSDVRDKKNDIVNLRPFSRYISVIA